jgi:signal transduction histidine kinase
MIGGLRLRSLGLILAVGAFLAGLGSAWLWSASALAWQNHLTRSFVAGLSIHEALRIGAPMPPGITAEPLARDQSRLADQGGFARLKGVPQPAFVTIVSIHGQSRDPIGGETMSLGIVSDKLRYAVSELVSDQGQSAAEKFGNVTRLLATYCSDAVIFARLDDDLWWRIEARQIWGCAARPTDNRLIAVIVAAIALAMAFTLTADISAHFDRFARALRGRRRLGGPESYVTEGPEELRDIVASVNSYLEAERAQLSKRAIVLSGVSHDLGTPATRLRLRAALIADEALREKLEADIDRMTSMIDSVLTYTRAELNVEEPRQISLTSFVEALVADYQDTGQPVEMRGEDDRLVQSRVGQGAQSVFALTPGQGATIPEDQPVLVTARPIALNRALSNLIDNALKYGRRASVSLTADADNAVIVVEDEGSGMSPADIETVIAPFTRGANTGVVDGLGLGLTIVATVAEQHGGSLSFESGAQGLRACLQICRT